MRFTGKNNFFPALLQKSNNPKKSGNLLYTGQRRNGKMETSFNLFFSKQTRVSLP